MRLRLFAAALALVVAVPRAKAQEVALRTNFVYWATTTPNLALEVSAGRRNTFLLQYALNPWKATSGKSIRHYLIQPEYRRWFCGAFDGWFIGVFAHGGQFNAGNIDLPMDMLKGLANRRFEGWYIGGGVNVGYQWVMSKHWNFEASVGVGYDYAKYDEFRCGVCGEKVDSSHKSYVGPTNAALSLLYIF